VFSLKIQEGTTVNENITNDRCDFNAGTITAGNEFVVCAPGRNIGQGFKVDMTVGTTSVLGDPNWSFVIYFTDGSTQETPTTHFKGHTTQSVAVDKPQVERIAFKNKNNVWPITSSGTVYLAQ
jgi:hypothetical protein